MLGSRLFEGKQAQFLCPGNCVAAIVDFQFGEDVAGVGADGVGRDDQLCGNLLVRMPRGKERQYVHFAIGQGFYERRVAGPCGGQ